MHLCDKTFQNRILKVWNIVFLMPEIGNESYKIHIWDDRITVSKLYFQPNFLDPKHPSLSIFE